MVLSVVVILGYISSNCSSWVHALEFRPRPQALYGKCMLIVACADSVWTKRIGGTGRSLNELVSAACLVPFTEFDGECCCSDIDQKPITAGQDEDSG